MTYFPPSDDAPSTPPPGFMGVLARAQWKGVIDFARTAAMGDAPPLRWGRKVYAPVQNERAANGEAVTQASEYQSFDGEDRRNRRQTM